MSQTNALQTDVYMTTQHKKKEKPKVTFAMVLNKVLVGALILTTVATSSTVPAYADSTVNTTNYADSKATVAQNYETSVENAVYNVNQTLAALNEAFEKGVLNLKLAEQLASQLVALDKAIAVSGKAAPSEVLDVIKASKEMASKLTARTNADAQSWGKKVNAAIVVLQNTVDTAGSAGVVVSENRETAAPTVKLTDISKHWAKSNIEYLVAKGGIAGYTENGVQVFKPDRTISKCEFLKIALYSATPDAVRTPSDGKHWASGVFEDALDKHILKPGEMPRADWNEPITRYEMTMIMTRISSEIQKEKQLSTVGIATIMEDYDKVQQKGYYTDYVEQAFMRGLITGVNANGKFNGDANGTRAEAATMVVRLIDSAKRVKVVVNKPSTTNPANPSQRAPMVLKATDPSRPMAIAGDTFIKPDGTKVVLKVGPSGVLGEGQGVAIDLGRSNGVSVVRDGYQAANNDYGPHAGDTFSVNPYTGEGHWVMDEWGQIANKTYPTYNGAKEGELSKDKNWEWTTMYQGGAWVFVIEL